LLFGVRTFLGAQKLIRLLSDAVIRATLRSEGYAPFFEGGKLVLLSVGFAA